MADTSEAATVGAPSTPDRGPRPGVLAAVSGWLVALTFVSVVALVVALVAVGTGGGPGARTTGATRTVDVELFDLGVRPKAIDVAAGTHLVMNVTNTGQLDHDLALAGGTPTTGMLKPGQKLTVDYGTVESTTAAWCTVPGHREAGMEMAIRVTGTSGSSGATASQAAAGGATGATIDVNAKPPADFTPRDPTAPAPLPGTVHQVTIETREAELEVAPGVTQQMWTFNLVGEQPTVPGPILRGKVGDTFEVTLVNKGSVEHSIDFHASRVAWDKKMRSLKPGESLRYDFTAGHAGAFMYHCGTSPALHHIGNGMYGAIIIDPPTLAPVAHEYVLVQSEIYTGPPGRPGDLTKMQQDSWDAVVFNGYVNQYKHVPIRVEPDQRVRVWVVDDGPSENSAFHVVGTVFDTVWKEGTYLLQPDARRGGAQVLDLQPAQGGFVEFSFAEAGLYPIVTHKFSNVGKGALGLFQAGEVTPAGGAGH